MKFLYRRRIRRKIAENFFFPHYYTYTLFLVSRVRASLPYNTMAGGRTTAHKHINFLLYLQKKKNNNKKSLSGRVASVVMASQTFRRIRILCVINTSFLFDLLTIIGTRSHHSRWKLWRCCWLASQSSRPKIAGPIVAMNSIAADTKWKKIEYLVVLTTQRD